MVDPLLFEAHFDAEYANMPMPPEYRDHKMTVQCNDCLEKSIVPFHIMGGKCTSCRSFNTTRVGDETIAPDAQEDEGETSNAADGEDNGATD